MTCNMSIPSVTNTQNKNHLRKNIFNEFNSTYYDDKNYGSELILKTVYIYSINNIDYTSLIKERKGKITRHIMKVRYF